jgi:hypothetical protein
VDFETADTAPAARSNARKRPLASRDVDLPKRVKRSVTGWSAVARLFGRVLLAHKAHATICRAVAPPAAEAVPPSVCPTCEFAARHPHDPEGADIAVFRSFEDFVAEITGQPWGEEGRDARYSIRGRGKQPSGLPRTAAGGGDDRGGNVAAEERGTPQQSRFGRSEHARGGRAAGQAIDDDTMKIVASPSVINAQRPVAGPSGSQRASSSLGTGHGSAPSRGATIADPHRSASADSRPQALPHIGSQARHQPAPATFRKGGKVKEVLKFWKWFAKK